MANTYLVRTPSSAGNRKTFTISTWIKRSKLSYSYAYIITAGEYNQNQMGQLKFDDNDRLNFSGTVATVAATGDGSITYSEVGSVLTNASQANCTLNSSTGVITTSDFGGSSTNDTQYNFTLRATDAQGQTADRAFSLTSSFGSSGGGQFN